MKKSSVFAVVLAAGALLSASSKEIKAMPPKAYTFYNIVPCNPGREKLQAQAMIELEARTGINTALYSLTLHPEGYPASKKADLLIESYRKFSRALKGSKVRPGVLIQSILGHWPRVDKVEEKWTRTVDITGKTPRFCPWDKNFRAYIFNTVAALAKERPCFIMGDDDIRGFSPKAECFCKLHTAEFNRRMGTAYTPAQLRKAVKECKMGDRIYTAFNQMRYDTVKSVCALIREAINSVDPTIPAAVCAPGWERCFHKGLSQAIASKSQVPAMRVANGFYMEISSQWFASNCLNTMAFHEYYKDSCFLLDETDTCPHSLYSKSARSFHTKIAAAAFIGLKGSKIWYVNGYKGTTPVSRNYTDILSKYRHFDQVLAKTASQGKSEGIIIPVSDRMTRWHPAGDQLEFFVSDKHWVDRLLGVYGIPFKASFSLKEKGVYAVAGSHAIARYTDEELKQLLSRKVLLDGAAAAELTRRGFGRYLGVTAEYKDFKFNREVSSDGKKSYAQSFHKEVPFLKVINPKAQVITNLCYAPSAYSPEKEVVAPASVIYKNELGGKICTTSFTLSALWIWAREDRKEWLVKMLELLNGRKLPFAAAAEQWQMLLQKTLPDKSALLGMFNLGYDPQETLVFRCARKPVKAAYLTAEGQWKQLKFSWNKGMLELPLRLECYEMAALRLFY